MRVCMYACMMHICTRVFMHVCMHIVCMYVCMYACMRIFRTLRFAHWKPTHLIIHVGNPCSSRIGILVVVYNRAVIEIQGYVCLVVVKNITTEGLMPTKVIGQKQCHPALQCYRYFMLFESASCENSETSCLESWRKFYGVKFIRNRYS